MNEHPTIEDLQNFRSGRIEGDAVLAIGRHLASCSVCVSNATRHMQLDRAAAALVEDIERADEAPKASSRTFSWPVLAAAASIAIVVISFVLRPSPATAPAPIQRAPVIRATPRPTTPIATPPQAPHRPQPRGEWSELVERVRGGAPIAMPEALRSIRAEADVLRGNGSARSEFKPSGVVVRSTRPQIGWPAANGAESVVQIFHGEEEVMRSGVLTTSQWRPSSALTRGETYTWQVRVTRDDETKILPASPEPVARFHVIDAKTANDLDKAEQAHPDDPLLLGLLFARAGLTDDARTQLERVTDADDATAATHVLHEIDSWNASQ